jgi:hypothetical protein
MLSTLNHRSFAGLGKAVKGALLALSLACNSRRDVLIFHDPPGRVVELYAPPPPNAAGQPESLSFAPVEVAPVNIGAYFMDGTSLDDRAHTTMWTLAHHSNRAVIRIARYFPGPNLWCDVPGRHSCEERVEAMRDAICDDLHSGAINAFVVFGFSRGVWIANLAAKRAVDTCNAAGKYLYAGLLDGVLQSEFLRGTLQVPKGTRWHHLMRGDFGDLVYPNSNVQADEALGTRDLIKGMSHPELGTSGDVAKRLVQEANKWSGMPLFR